MHPDELFEQLKKTANSRKQRSLDLIHEICREQHERGSKDFSVATIARISAERGGPIKGSIHNKTGDDFKGLIRVWADYAGGLTRKIRPPSDNPYEALIGQIDSPALRSMMLGILAENRKLRREITLLKSQSERTIDLRDREVAKKPQDDVIQILPASSGLLPSEIEALRHAISDKFLADEGWSADERGRVLNDLKRTLYKPGYVTAIQKIVGPEAPSMQALGQTGARVAR